MAADTLPTLDPARHDIACRANLEVQVLAQTLRKFMEDNNTAAEVEAAARGILSRIIDLSDIVFEAVLNENESRHDVPKLRESMGMEPEPKASHD